MNSPDEFFTLFPIGYVRRTKKDIRIEIIEEFIPALKELEQYSHVHIIWWMHKTDREDFRHPSQYFQEEEPFGEGTPTTGVFALRGNVRPNPIGITIAKTIGINHKKGQITIQNIDAIDRTPVLDLKPYEPIRDRVKEPTIPEWLRINGLPREWIPDEGRGSM